MRSWQRSAMVWTRWPLVSATRSRNSSVGTAAQRSGLASRQSKTSSAMVGDLAAPPQAGEEGVDRRPRLLAAVEALPVQLDQADQLVAGVDRGEVAVEAAAGAVQDQRLHVGDQVG